MSVWKLAWRAAKAVSRGLDRVRRRAPSGFDCNWRTGCKRWRTSRRVADAILRHVVERRASERCDITRTLLSWSSSQGGPTEVKLYAVGAG